MDGTAEQVNDQREPDEQQVFIDAFQELLSTEGGPQLTLTNIFKEMPISHPASLCEVKGRHVELQTCELQLAAMLQCNDVYIESHRLGRPVLGQLEEVDIRRLTARVSGFCYRDLYVNRRSAVRVRFKRPISITARTGANRISGVIHDISLEGCCLNTLVRQGFQESDLQLELKLMAPTTSEELAMQIPATLVRISEDGPPFKCILCFNHTQQSEHLLSVYVNQRQHEILRELRDSL
ncbi:PilZ domain-containing protein [Geomonas sp.]|uniref:PilZ domain-containing protein n=1 Tax=Geomonas sp. TaxID=2651584 RepID=UPI002B4A52D9|nr:PilZ domain-containing protein [Geomonas sp.]HJV33542.1 PilZ domain-containing protein [Geomonas sp.]